MQIFFSFYKLKKKQKSNSKTHSTYQNGVLIKIVDSDGHFGVADLCPWPELGDLPLQREIANKGILFQRSMQLAQTDLAARQAKIPLVSSAVVNNHILISDYQIFTFEMSDKPYIYKVKGNKNYKSLSEWLHQHQKSYASIRLDFNSCLTYEEFSTFVEGLSVDVLKKIEIVEDPFPFDMVQWTSLQNKISLAADFQKGSWPQRIFKPARQSEIANPVYLTSSMDHPVGIVHGLHFAQKFPQKIHGFLTLDMYDRNKYSEAFLQDHQRLTYLSDGYGIGFTTLLAKENWIPQIEWEKAFDTILLFNPQSDDQDLKNLFQIKKEFLKSYPQDHILISSSGSTQNPGDLKVLAFHKNAILQSARRVVRQFELTSDMNWGCVLPLFHVGGLGVLARAYVAGAKVFYCNWSDFTNHSVDFLGENNIQVLSLVPTQVFDLVNRKICASKTLKYVFVGGGFLDEKVESQAKDLGWSLILTYGMTETASMISTKTKSGDFQLFNGVDIFQKGEKFFVNSDSNAMAQLNFSKGQILFSNLINQSLEIPDRLQLNLDGTFKILGRADDQIKINGELVNLSRLKSILPFDFQPRLEIVPLVDDRKGFKLALVGEQIAIEELRCIVKGFNQNVNKFEKIELLATLDKFPRTALHKIKFAELKKLIEVNGAYEKL